MPRNAKIVRFFGDAEHDFRIGLGESEELDEAFGWGLVELLQRMQAIHVREVAAVLRVGLVGGGMRKDKAARLVALHFIPAYYVEGAGIASDAISAALVGVPDDPPDPKAGEPDGEANPAAPSPMAA